MVVVQVRLRNRVGQNTKHHYLMHLEDNLKEQVLSIYGVTELGEINKNYYSVREIKVFLGVDGPMRIAFTQDECPEDGLLLLKRMSVK